MTAYKGDYDTFERTRAEHMKNQQKAFEANERSRDHMQVCVLSIINTEGTFLTLLYCLIRYDCIPLRLLKCVNID